MLHWLGHFRQESWRSSCPTEIAKCEDFAIISWRCLIRKNLILLHSSWIRLRSKLSNITLEKRCNISPRVFRRKQLEKEKAKKRRRRRKRNKGHRNYRLRFSPIIWSSMTWPRRKHRQRLKRRRNPGMTSTRMERSAKRLLVAERAPFTNLKVLKGLARPKQKIVQNQSSTTRATESYRWTSTPGTTPEFRVANKVCKTEMFQPLIQQV